MAPATPQHLAKVDRVPHGATAQRLTWNLLPPLVRGEVERRLGCPVAHAVSAGAGFTPGLASTLTCEDGTRHFLKAANKVAQRPFADAYRAEIRNLQALPDSLPLPRPVWAFEDEAWVVLCLEHVEGHNPARPWRRADLDACLDTLEVLADRLTPPPPGMQVPTFADEFTDLLGCWEQVGPAWPHREEAAALAAGFAESTAGETVVHTDARDDNLLLGDGRAQLCDWNFCVRGAAWVDTVVLLLAAHGDGLDADELLARRRLTRDVDGGDVDALLALLAGYFLQRRELPAPSSSPWLRVHANWYAEATWSWLARRRGWT